MQRIHRRHQPAPRARQVGLLIASLLTLSLLLMVLDSRDVLDPGQARGRRHRRAG
jgi:hypothetical protein